MIEWASFVVYGLAAKLNIGAHQLEDSAPGNLPDFFFAHLHDDKTLRDKCLALAVDWCQRSENGFESIYQIKDASKVADFVEALKLKPGKSKCLINAINKYQR